MKKYLTILAAMLMISNTLFAQITYELDPSFDGDGVVDFSTNYTIRVVKAQADGKILAIEQDSLFRLLPDGTRDTSFGTNGATGVYSYANDLEVMPDGAHIAVLVENTSSSNNGGIYIYTSSGELTHIIELNIPPCFCDIIAVSNTVIRVTACNLEDVYEYDIFSSASSLVDSGIPDGVSEGCTRMEYQSGYMVTSYVQPFYQNDSLFVSLHIAKNGDPSFGNNGLYSKTIYDPTQYRNHGTWLQSDGKIVFIYELDYFVHIERLNADGTPDSTFTPLVIEGLISHHKQMFVVNSKNEIIIALYNQYEEPMMKLVSSDGNQVTDITGHIFSPEIYLSLYSIDIQADDDILIGGRKGESIVAKFSRKIYSNAITGNVFGDDNKDCIRDNDEKGLHNWFIKIQGDYTTYARTDTNGNYTIPLDTGTYSLSTVLPNYTWTGTCPEDTTVIITANTPDTTIDFAVIPIDKCPLLQVDIAAPFLVRCLNAHYVVEYCNDGTADAEDAYIEVQLDPYLNFLHSTIPSTDLGDNLYSFDLGNVRKGACGTFKIHVNVDCDSTELGQTHCTTAHIYPDSTCLPPDPLWDGASIMLMAECVEDSIAFTIENVGTGDMSDSLEYIVVEDDLMWPRTNFKLNSGDNIKLHKEAKGTFYRLETEQSPGHPGNNMPSIFVEGCGTNDDGGISTGFVNYYPLNEADPFISIDCQENIGSYDPNDKQAFPNGYGDQHYIADDTNLEYLIRFQNTGTYTALNVVIRDTISPHLNIETLRPGAASHPYQYDIDGSNVAVFTFDNIMLPDSTTNEVDSHGFIKFSIQQQANNDIGTVIENDAAIYFDFNEPVITNTVFHTIGEDFVNAVTSIITPPEVTSAGISVNVFPNPFDEYTTFEVKGSRSQELHLRLYDVMGREVLYQKASNRQYITLHKNNLPSGIYVFKLMDEKQALSTGKLVIE